MSVNKAIIIGNLGADPEVKTSQGGTTFANLSVATNEKWTDKSGQKQERTEWHRVTVFGKTAENCGKYLKKGRQVYVEGKIQTDKYEKDGQTHYSTKIVAQNVTFLSGGTAERSSGQQGGFESSGFSGGFDQSFVDEDIPF